MQLRILSIGHNSRLLRLRNAAIQKAGYQVTTTKETALMMELAQKQHFDAVVMCSSMPLLLRQHIASQLKRRKASMPLVIICEEEERERFYKWANIVIVAPSVEQTPLIKAIERAIGRPGKIEKTA